ncbi:MAG: 4'-phosphopantetheinyl transferase superfamily protein [Bacteroidales bacterium]
MLKIFVYNIKGFEGTPSKLAHQFLTHLLEEELHEKAENLYFAKHAQGKPYLISHPHIHFNISHSFDYIAIALSDKPVGIDIEKIRTRNYKPILERYFAAEEQNYIFSLDPEKQNASFIQLWTLKECFLKYKGCGIANNIEAYPLVIDPLNHSVQVKNNKGEIVFFHTQCLAEEYYISLCTPRTSEAIFYFQDAGI